MGKKQQQKKKQQTVDPELLGFHFSNTQPHIQSKPPQSRPQDRARDQPRDRPQERQYERPAWLQSRDQARSTKTEKPVTPSTSDQIVVILQQFTRDTTVVCAGCKQQQKFNAGDIEMLRTGCRYAREQMNPIPEVPAAAINCACGSL